jgi:hypothetical protein
VLGTAPVEFDTKLQLITHKLDVILKAKGLRHKHYKELLGLTPVAY